MLIVLGAWMRGECAYFGMAPSETPTVEPCSICGDIGHPYRNHLKEVEVPPFVGAAVDQLRELEQSGSHIDGLIENVKLLVNEEDGGRRAWAIWLLGLLEELEDAADAPDVAAEIEEYLLGGYAS